MATLSRQVIFTLRNNLPNCKLSTIQIDPKCPLKYVQSWSFQNKRVVSTMDFALTYNRGKRPTLEYTKLHKLSNIKGALLDKCLKLHVPWPLNFDTKRLLCSVHTHQCWNCNKSVDTKINQYFCECGVIQAPVTQKNYFDVMGVEVSFEQDEMELTRRFRDLQRLLHPDKFTIKSETEQEISAQQSSLVNEAYRTLLKPMARGLYILKLNGYDLEDGEIQIDPEFLMDVMEINETVAETNSIEELEGIKKKNQENLDRLIKEVSMVLKVNNFSLAKELLSELKYYANIHDKLEDAIERVT